MSTRTATTRGSTRRTAEDPRSDEQTRAKLLDAAGRVFAERGFHGATTREICQRARANIAAVNYHFRDKVGLYTEVLRLSIRAAELETMHARSSKRLPPDQVLRQVIRIRLQSLFSADRPDWAFRLMAHEFAQPTPAMAHVVDEVIRPAYRRLREAVGAILGLPPDHDTTRLCAHSIIAQAVHYFIARPIVARLWPELEMTPEQLDRIADHIADFSLAYMQTFKSRRRRVQSSAHGGRRT